MRGAHLDQAGAKRLVPFRVAIAVEFARRRVVARDPVLVIHSVAINQDRIAPCESIGRAADTEIYSRTEEEALNQPHLVFRVINYRGIAGGAGAAMFVIHRPTRQRTEGPSLTAIGGCAKSQVGAAAWSNASHLKCGNHR